MHVCGASQNTIKRFSRAQEGGKGWGAEGRGCRRGHHVGNEVHLKGGIGILNLVKCGPVYDLGMFAETAGGRGESMLRYMCVVFERRRVGEQRHHEGRS